MASNNWHVAHLLRLKNENSATNSTKRASRKKTSFLAKKEICALFFVRHDFVTNIATSSQKQKRRSMRIATSDVQYYIDDRSIKGILMETINGVLMLNVMLFSTEKVFQFPKQTQWPIVQREVTRVLNYLAKSQATNSLPVKSETSTSGFRSASTRLQQRDQSPVRKSGPATQTQVRRNSIPEEPGDSQYDEELFMMDE